MIVAINCRLIVPGKMDGIGWFAYHVVKQMAAGHPEIKFILFFDRQVPEEFRSLPNATPVTLFPQARHPILYILWFEIAISKALNKYRPDIFISTDGFLSLNSKTRQLAVIHDINFEHFPEDIPYLTRKYYQFFFRRFAAKAERIATVSEFSKRDIVNTYGISADKIDVVYNGVDENYRPLKGEIIAQTRNEFTQGAPYFIFVGSMHPRKNIVNMLQAFDMFKVQSGSDFKLVLAGNKKWWSGEMEHTYNQMQFNRDVVFTGRINQSAMVDLVGSAFAMLYVSRFEGFGVPMLEAMRSGIPVIAGNNSSMPEVAGGAALLADASNHQEIAGAMHQLVSDNDLYRKLVAAGLNRSSSFSWELTTERLWMSALRTISGH